MDILTHTFSGIAVGTVVSSFARTGFKDKLKIIALSGFAAALPDFDAVSLWSGFDSTIGKLFGLSVKGKEIYSAKFWYSHHAFLHSAFAAILFASVIGISTSWLTLKSKEPENRGLLNSLIKNKLLLISFILSY